MCENIAAVKDKNPKTEENIALTGLMGSGKSSVGRTLSRLLRRKFIDTDALIEEREGLTVNEIFTQKGEEYFRRVEQELIKEIFTEPGQVVSLGGGDCGKPTQP